MRPLGRREEIEKKEGHACGVARSGQTHSVIASGSLAETQAVESSLGSPPPPGSVMLV